MSSLRTYVVLFALCALVWSLRMAAGRLAPRAAILPLVFLITRIPVLVTWTIGTIAIAAMMIPKAMERGHDSVKDIAMLGAISLLCGGGVAAMVVGPVWLIVRAFGENPIFDLEAGERIVAEMPVNHFLRGEARAGKLIVTNERVGFRPNRFNVQLDTWSAPLGSIEGVEREGQRLVVVRIAGQPTPEWLIAPNAGRVAEVLQARPAALGA